MHLQSLLCRLYFTCKERPNRIFIVAFGIDYGAPRETRTLTRQSLNLPPLPNWAIGAFIQDTKRLDSNQHLQDFTLDALTT